MGPPHYAPAPCKWWLEQPPRAFRLRGHRACIYIYIPVPKIWLIVSHGVNGLVTLTFDILTSKWGHGSPSCGLLSVNFQLHAPFRSPLSVRHRTDRGTDRQRRPAMHNAPLYGGGDITVLLDIGVNNGEQSKCVILAVYHASFSHGRLLLCYWPIHTRVIFRRPSPLQYHFVPSIDGVELVDHVVTMVTRCYFAPGFIMWPSC